MSTTLTPNVSGSSPRPSRPRSRRAVAVSLAAAVAAAALGVSLGVALSGSSKSAAGGTAASYSYYQSVIGRHGPASMMGAGGYGWMMGGAHPPGWMAGSGLPGSMMGSSADPGEVMGSLFADAPGPRVSSAQAARLAGQVPAGASVDRAAMRITFAGSSVAFAVVASPAAADDKFEVAGLVNPTIVVPAGARVSIQFVNADSTSAHGLVVTAAGASTSWMPMMTSPPAFTAAAAWFLGDATAAGAHIATVTFTAATAGSYQYLCPVPGHAQKGMAGAFIVAG